MIIEILFIVIYIIVSFLSGILFSKIQNNDLPLHLYLAISFISSLVGMYYLKYSNLSLLEQSALITLSTRFGYLIGLIYIGNIVTTVQWLGMIVIIIGCLLTNK